MGRVPRLGGYQKARQCSLGAPSLAAPGFRCRHRASALGSGAHAAPLPGLFYRITGSKAYPLVEYYRGL